MSQCGGAGRYQEAFKTLGFIPLCDMIPVKPPFLKLYERDEKQAELFSDRLNIILPKSPTSHEIWSVMSTELRTLPLPLPA